MAKLYTYLREYKWFSAVFIVMIVLLLSRIPMGTFNNPSTLDIFGHFVLVATGAPLLIMPFMHYKLIPHAISPFHFMLLTTLLGITLAVVWEIIEFVIDMLFGLSWQLSNSDTMTDIILGVFGAVFGAIIFVKMHDIKLQKS